MIVGIRDARSLKGFSDFVVAGRRQGRVAVLMSVLATIIGASTTIGIVDTAFRIGFPAVWWLLLGSLGLLVQSLTIASRFRSFQADTLPDVARITVGRGAEMLLAVLICVAWIGVFAGQFVWHFFFPAGDGQPRHFPPCVSNRDRLYVPWRAVVCSEDGHGAAACDYLRHSPVLPVLVFLRWKYANAPPGIDK